MFGLVGGVATITHVATALVAHDYGRFAPLTANFSGYVCAVLVSYFGHARLTFQRPALQGQQFARFVITSLSVLVLNQLIVFVGVNLIHAPFAWALVPAVIVVPVVTFAISKLWAFADSARPGA